MGPCQRISSRKLPGESLPAESALSETLIQGLRLRDGILTDRLTERFGIDPAARFENEIDSLKDRGLLEVSAGALRLTHLGLLLANDVALELLP